MLAPKFPQSGKGCFGDAFEHIISKPGNATEYVIRFVSTYFRHRRYPGGRGDHSAQATASLIARIQTFRTRGVMDA